MGLKMQIVIAMDSLKGCLTSMEAGKAVAEGIRRADPKADIKVMPLADGGEGTADSLIMGMGGMPYLLYEGRKVEIGHFPFTVGKENTDFTINKNVISRSHIRILCREDDYFVVDENSKNHTWLNGRRITPYTETLLKDGDTLRLANEILTFHI